MSSSEPGLSEEVIERLIRAGALDSLSRPRRELLWQLREVSGASRGRVDGRTARTVGRATKRAAGRPMDLRLPPTPAPPLPEITERERLGNSYAVLSLDARRQVVELFRPALERLGAVTNAVAGGSRAGTGSARRPRGDAAAPDDRARDGVPGARGRDRDGQRHALARHVGPAARRRPPARAAARRRNAAARGQRGERDRPRGHGRSSRRRAGWAGPSSRPASASSATRGCGGWAEPRRRPVPALPGPARTGASWTGACFCFWRCFSISRRCRPGWRGTGTAGSSRRTRRSRCRTAPTAGPTG